MQTVKIEVTRSKARELYRAYKTHQHYSKPIDQEIQRAYQLIAQGRVIIKALESIRLAGTNDQGLPKLAIANAEDTKCPLRIWSNGSAVMGRDRSRRDHTNTFRFPNGFFTRVPTNPRYDYQAIVPLVPIHLRPRRALAAYHVLWEAEWERVVPRDPMLLRRIGGDMWLVVAAWDLTEVERAAMATRISA